MYKWFFGSLFSRLYGTLIGTMSETSQQNVEWNLFIFSSNAFLVELVNLSLYSTSKKIN